MVFNRSGIHSITVPIVAAIAPHFAIVHHSNPLTNATNSPITQPRVAVPHTAFGLPQCSRSEMMAIEYRIHQCITCLIQFLFEKRVTPPVGGQRNTEQVSKVLEFDRLNVSLVVDKVFEIWVPENQLVAEVDHNHSIAAVIESAPLFEREWSGSTNK